MKGRDLDLTILVIIGAGILYGAIYSCLAIAAGESLLWLLLAIPCIAILGLVVIGLAEDGLKRSKTANRPQVGSNKAPRESGEERE